ncbi:MAG: ATP-binding protein [Bacteroidia bacterium]
MKFKGVCYTVFLILFNLANVFSQTEPPVAKGGVLDLRRYSFDQFVGLNGEWKFYWQKLIMPTDSTKGINVSFPVKWNEMELNGEKLPSFGYATYSLTLLLPQTEQQLRIAMPDVYCAYSLFLNGKLVAVNGKVADNAKQFVPHWEYREFDVPLHADTVRLVLQIANFVHSKGGIKDPIFIGKSNEIALARTRAEAIDLMLTGCLLMGGLFFLGLYLLGNRDKAILLFSLYSIVYSYRIMGVGNYVLHSIFPNASWELMVHLEYISLFAAIGLFGLYTKYLYPEDVDKILINILSCFCLLFIVATLALSPLYFSQLINPFLVITVFCIVYSLYIYALAYKRNRPGSKYALMSSMALMFTFGLTLLNYWGVVPVLQLFSFWGYVTFFFLQSLILSHRVSFQLKKARVEAEQGLIAKSEFLSTMSHEIRTPLNSVIGMSHLLLKNNPREDQAEHLGIMLFSANNLLGIVNDILDYNKIEAGKIELDYTEIDVVGIARNIVAGLQNNAQEKGVELKLFVDPSLTNKVLGDPTRIFQVLTNLVHNAIKFTNVGFVELSLTVLNQTDREIAIKFEVEDTGIGISKEKQSIIFDRFTQADSSTSRSFGGTGLGLAISKRILDLQGSTLHVTSEIGKGSVFYFIQSFKKTESNLDPVNVLENLSKEKEKPFKGVSILLVEDNPINVMVAKSFLQNWGAEVDVAENGKEAIHKLDIHRHQLILMDLHMPVMDGYEASQKLREMNVGTPIIALTANLRKDIEFKINEVHINDVIVKPFLPDELFQKVKKYTLDFQPKA